MAKVAGIWIDHRMATIVIIDEEGEKVRSVTSGVAVHPRIKGGSRSSSPYGVQDVVSESRVEERFRHQLHDYYRDVIRSVGEVEQIYLFGPGQARMELEEELHRVRDLGSRITGNEPADRMTYKQIAARVRDFYFELARSSE